MQALKEKGNLAYRAGKYADAVNFYSEAIQKDPSNAALFRYECTHNYYRCPRTAKHVPYPAPGPGPAHHCIPPCLPARSNRSLSNLLLGKHAEALADAQQAAKLKPEWEKGHFRCGAALEAMGDLAKVRLCRACPAQHSTAAAAAVTRTPHQPSTHRMLCLSRPASMAARLS